MRANAPAKTRGLAIALVLLMMGLVLLDQFVLRLGAPLFLARKGLATVEWLAVRRRAKVSWIGRAPGLG